MGNVASQMDWGPILSAFGAILVALLGYLSAWLKRKIAADAEKSKAELAALKITEWTVALAQKAWDRLSLDVQKAFADGSLSAEERAALEAEVKVLLAEVVSADELSKAAAALGLPLPGLIGRIAAGIIALVTQAHDPSVPTASVKTFPLNGEPGVGPGGAVNG